MRILRKMFWDCGKDGVERVEKDHVLIRILGWLQGVHRGCGKEWWRCRLVNAAWVNPARALWLWQGVVLIQKRYATLGDSGVYSRWWKTICDVRFAMPSGEVMCTIGWCRGIQRKSVRKRLIPMVRLRYWVVWMPKIQRIQWGGLLDKLFSIIQSRYVT